MFLKLRRKLINWLADDDIAVIINTDMYDSVLRANSGLGKSNLYKRNKIFSLEKCIQTEVVQRIDLDKQGIIKQGDALVLK